MPEKISSIGYGEARPVATNETPAGRARNRRIDLSHPRARIATLIASISSCACADVLLIVAVRCRAALAVHPAGVAVHVVLFLPDRHAVFHFIDDVAARGERFGAMP